MLKLKLQYFGHLMRRVDSLEKTLMLGGIGAGGEGDDRGWDGWMASQTRWTWVWVNSGRWWWTGRPGVLRFIGSQRVGHKWATELNWTEGSLSELVRCKWITPGLSRFESWCHHPLAICTESLCFPFHLQIAFYHSYVQLGRTIIIFPSQCYCEE